jgi:hypothetical protein
MASLETGSKVILTVAFLVLLEQVAGDDSCVGRNQKCKDFSTSVIIVRVGRCVHLVLHGWIPSGSLLCSGPVVLGADVSGMPFNVVVVDDHDRDWKRNKIRVVIATHNTRGRDLDD